MVTKREFADLQEKVLNQEKIINSLQLQVKILDYKVIQINAEKAFSSHINTILAEKLDDLCQYNRRPCIAMDGLPVEKGESIVQIEDSVKAVLKDNLGFTEETVNKEFDKAHRIGPKFYNRQQTIVKFRSHDFKSKVYNIRNSSTNSNIKIRPSLTKRREDLLEECTASFTGLPLFHFAFADCNGNIKIRTKSKIINIQYFNVRNR